jgi:hypothetical protein
MAYRRSHRYSRQIAAARAAKARLREEGPAPDYPVELPELRREVVVVDYDTGAPVVSHWRLYRTARVDCYRVEEGGRPWAGRHGWAKVLAAVRQRFPRVLSAEACG